MWENGIDALIPSTETPHSYRFGLIQFMIHFNQLVHFLPIGIRYYMTVRHFTDNKLAPLISLKQSCLMKRYNQLVNNDINNLPCFLSLYIFFCGIMSCITIYNFPSIYFLFTIPLWYIIILVSTISH